jgi:hypothetical protein
MIGVGKVVRRVYEIQVSELSRNIAESCIKHQNSNSFLLGIDHHFAVSLFWKKNQVVCRNIVDKNCV